MLLRRLERILDLRAGELGRGLLLFGYLFLVMSSFVVGKAVRDALFLDEFGALLLPYADIAVALLVGVWVWLYLRLSGRLSLRTLVIGSLVFFAGNCLIFWVFTRAGEVPWLTPVMYVWVGMFGVVAPAQVWTLANYVLTTREAKRLYGFIGSGATAGWIVGGYLTQVTVKAFGAESTLIGMAAALLGAAACANALLASRPRETREPREADEGRPGVMASMRLIGGSKYLMAIAAVILMSSYSTVVAGWQFRAMSSAAISGRDEMAAFFGKFNFYAGLLSFALQWLVAGRLLRKLGLSVTLFVVPVGLVLGSIGLLTFQSLAAVIALRGIDQVLRYSIDKPSTELLYLPVPAEQTLAVKSFIDTVVWRLGDGLAGLTILAAAGLGQMAAVELSWVNLVLLGAWMVAAFVAQRQYVINLRDSIQHYRLDAERPTATGLDRSATDLLARQLAGENPTEILYALRVLGADSGLAMRPIVRGLVSHESPEVRAEAIRVLDEAGDAEAQPIVEKALYDTDLGVRTHALLFVAHHTQLDPLDRIEQLGDFEDFSIRAAMVTFLSQPGAHENLDAARLLLDRMLDDETPRVRLEAARLFELLPDEFEDQMGTVLTSGTPEQIRHVVHAVGRLKKRKLVGRVIERLGDPGVAGEAAEVLVTFGDKVVGTLTDYLSDAATPVEVRRRIPSVLVRVATQSAYRVLAQCASDHDTQVRHNAIGGLTKLRDQFPAWPFDRKMVEPLLDREIKDHMRLYQILGVLDGALQEAGHLLAIAMTTELERIFRLLKLLYPRQDLHAAYVGVQSSNRTVHDNALEFLENILGPEVRSQLVPLLDGQVPRDQRIALANRILGTGIPNGPEAIRALLASEDPWRRSCGAHAIGALKLTDFIPELNALTSDADPMVWEAARDALSQLGQA